jgi:hypothetical protein
MSQFNRFRLRAGMRLAGFALACAAAAGCAVAETYQHGGSTTTVEQRGPGVSRSEVYRYPDGQAVITRDGGSTDITVQRSAPPPLPQPGGWRPEPGPSAGRFDRDAFAERFSGVAPDGGGCPGCGDAGAPSTREAYRQRMLERLHRPAAQ